MSIVINSLLDGFKIALSLKRIVPIFLVNIAMLSLTLITFYYYPILDFHDLISKSFLQIPLIIAVILVALWINGAIIDQAKNPKRKLDKSLTRVRKVYLRLLIAIIIFTILSGLLSMIPLIGWIITIIFAIIFLFYAQEIVLKNKYPLESFVGSARLFRKNILAVIIFFILLTIISVVIFIAGSFPVLIEIKNYFGNLPLIHLNLFQFGNALASIHTKIIPFLIIASFVSAFVKVFEISAKTRFYLKLR